MVCAPARVRCRATRRKQKSHYGAPTPHHTYIYIYVERCCTTVPGRNHCSALLWQPGHLRMIKGLTLLQAGRIPHRVTNHVTNQVSQNKFVLVHKHRPLRCMRSVEAKLHTFQTAPLMEMCDNCRAAACVPQCPLNRKLGGQRRLGRGGAEKFLTVAGNRKLDVQPLTSRYMD